MSCEELRDAVQRFFADTDRPPAETLEALLALRDEIEMLIASLQEEAE